MEIDDAMIDRFDKAAMAAGNTGENRLLYPPPDIRDVIRAGLEAALSPKPEPEIEVTEGMMRAGYEAAGGFYAISEATVENIYRAMESTRLKQAKS